MNAVLEKKENNKAIFNFEISEQKFEEAVQKAYLKNRGKINIPGFRKGKAPKQIIESTYGKEVFYEEALNIVLPEAYDEAIEQLNLEPVDSPQVDVEDIEKGKPIVVKIEVALKPEVKLGDYKGIEIEKIEYNVTDEILENELKSIQEMNGRITDAGDREVKVGDILTIDFAGSVDGEFFEGGTAENQNLEIGSNRFIPGFEDQLVGKRKGDVVDVNVKFPEDYFEESLKGKDANFKVTIHEIKERELPELDDEFAKDVSEFDTLAEYKESIKERLENEFSSNSKIERENNLIEKVVEGAELEIPEVMIDDQVETEVRDFAYRLQSQGIDLEQYLKATNSTIYDLRSQLRPSASKRVKADLVLEAIAKAENIEVKEEDIDKELEEIAKEQNQKDIAKFVSDMKKRDLEFLRKGITNNKVIELLLENAKFN